MSTWVHGSIMAHCDVTIQASGLSDLTVVVQRLDHCFWLIQKTEHHDVCILPLY